MARDERKWWQKVYDQVNVFDGGKTYKAATAAPKVATTPKPASQNAVQRKRPAETYICWSTSYVRRSAAKPRAY